MLLFLIPFLLSAALVAPAPPKEVGKHYFKLGKEGDYQYGYNDGHTVKEETRYADGSVRGSYRYVDGNSITQNVVYRADKNGYVASTTSERLGEVKETVPKMGIRVAEPLAVPPPPVVTTAAPITAAPTETSTVVVSDIDIRVGTEQPDKPETTCGGPNVGLPVGFPVVPALPKDGQLRSGEQPQVMYISFMIPYVMHPQQEASAKA
ncbi:cuticle protein 6-like [Armigeres subalbatus]|uniref:cuticle protein 6-like n=1 Tax=Armigeres subalbatus TaxID=124917 RepID=UPI002ED581B9